MFEQKTATVSRLTGRISEYRIFVVNNVCSGGANFHERRRDEANTLFLAFSRAVKQQ